MMKKIAKETEVGIDYWNRFKKRNVEKMGAYVEKHTPKKEDKNTFRRQINLMSYCFFKSANRFY